METITIKIINPKAKKLIKDLVALDLIEITPKGEKITTFLKKIRAKSDNPPTLEEITNYVEDVRTEIYNSKK